MINQKYINRKRYIDTFLALLGLIILSPVFLILIIAIKLDSPGPVLFKQKRVGLHKRHFNILKFRTMRIDTPKDTPTHLLENPDGQHIWSPPAQSGRKQPRGAPPLQAV